MGTQRIGAYHHTISYIQSRYDVTIFKVIKVADGVNSIHFSFCHFGGISWLKRAAYIFLSAIGLEISDIKVCLL